MLLTVLDWFARKKCVLDISNVVGTEPIIGTTKFPKYFCWRSIDGCHMIKNALNRPMSGAYGWFQMNDWPMFPKNYRCDVWYRVQSSMLHDPLSQIQ